MNNPFRGGPVHRMAEHIPETLRWRIRNLVAAAIAGLTAAILTDHNLAPLVAAACIVVLLNLADYLLNR